MKYIKSKRYAKYVDKILVLDKYLQNEKLIKAINTIFAKYWIYNSNHFFKLVFNKKEVGIIMGAIDCDHHVELDNDALNKLSTKYPESQDIIKFQQRITKTMSMLRDKNMPEVNCLCSLISGQNVGLNLIKVWEAELKKRKHKKYQLFSDENCNYEWYIRHGFKLVETIKLDMSGLDSLKKMHKEFKLYKFIKTI